MTYNVFHRRSSAFITAPLDSRHKDERLRDAKRLYERTTKGRARDATQELHDSCSRRASPVGLLKPADRAGYRNGQVYIRKSMHVPTNRGAVRDAMPALFDLLWEEPHPAVRVVLGHFIFVYIHP
jgi:Fic family protein